MPCFALLFAWLFRGPNLIANLDLTAMPQHAHSGLFLAPTLTHGNHVGHPAHGWGVAGVRFGASLDAVLAHK